MLKVKFWVFKIILKIYYKFFFKYLTIKNLINLIIKPKIRLINYFLLSNLENNKNLKKVLKIYFL